MLQSRALSIYGVTATVSCFDPQMLDWFCFDFRYFTVAALKETADIVLTVKMQKPPIAEMPPMDEIMHTRHFACFELGNKRYINYRNRALLVFDYKDDTGILYCADREFGYEKLYLTILSRVGEKLDRIGIHRVHALGITYKQSASLFLISEGGGKSTIGLSLLACDQIKLLSEDTPLVSNKGQLLPFPFRLGICGGNGTSDIPASFKREIINHNGTKKTLIESDYFSKQIGGQDIQTKYLFCGKWTTNLTGRIIKTSRLHAFSYLVRDCIFGLGLPQVIELFLTSGMKNVFQKAGIAWSRTMACLALLQQSECHMIYLCQNTEKNQQMILAFLEGQSVNKQS